jgi:hypothetical protein
MINLLHRDASEDMGDRAFGKHVYPKLAARLTLLTLTLSPHLTRVGGCSDTAV